MISRTPLEPLPTDALARLVVAIAFSVEGAVDMRTAPSLIAINTTSGHLLPGESLKHS
jgi:hypothetical protein